MDYAKILANSAPLVVGMIKRFVRDTVTPKGPSNFTRLPEQNCSLLEIAKILQGAQLFRKNGHQFLRSLNSLRHLF